MSCTSTPISWLRLERYHLGEVDASERKEIASHLASCAACKRAFAEITGEEVVVRGPWLTRPRAALAMSALAIAAAIFFVIGRTPRVPEDPGGTRIKGNDVALTLVTEGESVLPEAGGPYRDGDRFKALVTCPPGMQATWDLVVYENDQASFPLTTVSDLSCGNQVALPGAFKVTGHERMTVCLVWADGAIDREAIRRTKPANVRCVTLEPAP